MRSSKTSKRLVVKLTPTKCVVVAFVSGKKKVNEKCVVKTVLFFPFLRVGKATRRSKKKATPAFVRKKTSCLPKSYDECENVLQKVELTLDTLKSLLKTMMLFCDFWAISIRRARGLDIAFFSMRAPK